MKLSGIAPEDDALLLERALPDEGLPEAVRRGETLPPAEAVAGDQAERGLSVRVRLRHVERAVVSVHERRELRHDELGDGDDAPLTLHHAREPSEVRLQPVLLLVLVGRVLQIADHLVDVVFERGNLSLRLDHDRARQVTLRHGGGDLRDRAHLRGEVPGELIHVVGEIAPGTRRAGDLRLPAELSFEPDLARDRRHLVGEDAQRVGHVVDRLGEGGHFPLRFEDELLIQISVRDRGDDLDDTANLLRQVRRHYVDVVGQVLPDPGHARHLRFGPELPLDAYFARQRGHLVGERPERVGHVVDRLGEGGDFALRFEDELLAQIAVRDRGHDFDDPADLARQVGRHYVDVVGKVLPGSGDPLHLRLPAELPFGPDLFRNPRDLCGERIQLVDHLVDDVFDLEDFPLHVDGDLLGEVAVRNRGRDLRDVAQLNGEVRPHRVDVVGQVLPGPG